ncbi:MAG: YqaE/Pmp3 family membrane protein [Phycisphaerales bacterium]|nr:YqaE/Pmp3 family membrane protein [Phycisphaerales bacterium]
MADFSANTLLLVIIAILLPPLAVGLKRGIGGHLILSIVLTLIFYLPGILHALWVVLAK